MNSELRVMIAGIAGASLGTEILKCLMLAGGYTIFGCDISPLAYGHYVEEFEQTFLVDRANYVDSVLDVCRQARCDFVIPGGEEPMILLAQAKPAFDAEGVRVAMNSHELVKLLSNKLTCFELLSELGFRVPVTRSVTNQEDLNGIPFPCMIKPATGSGGSVFAFIAGCEVEALRYIEYLIRNDQTPVIQEYVPIDEGEFSIGVLSLLDGSVAGSVALRKVFASKLSITMRGKDGLITSPYSQGFIDEFPEVRTQAQRIAVAIRSRGPINIQGRIRDGIFVPFEINPRFSGGMYLRAMAGFNDVDAFLQYLATGDCPLPQGPVRTGYYLRSLTETFVPVGKIKHA